MKCSLKLFIVMVVLTSLMLISSTCLATVELAPSAAALGGIRPGAKTAAVQKIYGMPNHRGESYTGDGDRLEVWTYGDSFSIYFMGNTVVLLKTTANNGIKTPAGLSVGSNINTVYNTYGAPFVDQSPNALWYRTSDGVDLVYMFKYNKCSEIRCGYPL